MTKSRTAAQFAGWSTKWKYRALTEDEEVYLLFLWVQGPNPSQTGKSQEIPTYCMDLEPGLRVVCWALRLGSRWLPFCSISRGSGVGALLTLTFPTLPSLLPGPPPVVYGSVGTGTLPPPTSPSQHLGKRAAAVMGQGQREGGWEIVFGKRRQEVWALVSQCSKHQAHAPLSYQTSLIKHKFKDKNIKNLKAATLEH